MTQVVMMTQRTADNEFPEEYFGLANEDHFWCRWRAAVLFRHLKTLEIDTAAPLAVFDIGCGNGVVRRQVEQVTSWVTDGTDFSLEALRQNDHVRGTTYYYDIIEQRPEFRERYDIIILFDVLEHVRETEKFLTALSFHLKPGGWLFVNVPALNLLRSPYDDVQGHYRRYTRAMLTNEFTNLPFTFYRIGYWGLLQVPLLLARKIILLLFVRGKDVYSVGFHPPGPLFNSIMTRMMRWEMSLLRNSPLGTSVMAVLKKKQ